MPRLDRAARGLALAIFALAVLPLAHCDDSEPTAPPTSGTIGPAGGALASSDYVFEILVPAGALSADVGFTITPVGTPGGATYAPSYSITTSPAAVTFAAPAVLSFSEEGMTFTSTNDLTDYRVSSFVANAWAPLVNPSVDALAVTIEGTATSLSGSAYSVIIPTGGSCVIVTDSCSAAEDAGAEAGASSCTASCSVSIPPSLPARCGAYPGSVSGACTSDGGASISIACCYPVGTPICFTQLEPNGCGSPCSQFPGSTTTSCVPDVGPPLDNTSSGGASVATCCYPAGTALADGGVSLDDAGAGADAGGSGDAGGNRVGDAGGNGDAGGIGDAGGDANGNAHDSGTDAGTDAGPVDSGDDGG
jgi:hypothetical protein